MANIRIKDLSTDSALSAGDYVVVDSASEGSRKFDLGAELTSIKEDLTDLEEQISIGGMGVSDDLKAALLQLAEKIAYIDENGATYYADLYDALYPPISATSITLSSDTLTFASLNSTQALTATLAPTDTTDTVTWSSSNTSIATVSNAGVVTALAYGSAVITATAGNVSATCSVVVAQATLSSISATYTQSGTVYDTDSLDSLKADLVVTATWSNNTTTTVASDEYVLSGTLSEGTSTITVTYGGKTATFTVTVTHYVPLTTTVSWSGSGSDKTSTVIDASQHDAYYTLPYVEGDSRLVADAPVTTDNAFTARDVAIYTDAECTQWIGYYRVDTGVLTDGGSRRTTAQSPKYKLDAEIKVVPRGYYGKMMLAKSGSTIFSSNGNFGGYLNANGTTVVLK